MSDSGDNQMPSRSRRSRASFSPPTKAKPVQMPHAPAPLAPRPSAMPQPPRTARASRAAEEALGGPGGSLEERRPEPGEAFAAGGRVNRSGWKKGGKAGC